MKTIGAVGGLLDSHPVAMPQMLAAVDLALDPPQQIIVVGDPDSADTRALVDAVYRRFLPRRILLVIDPRGTDLGSGKVADFYRSLETLDGRATAFICENYACRLPTNDLTQLEKFLDGRD